MPAPQPPPSNDLLQRMRAREALGSQRGGPDKAGARGRGLPPGRPSAPPAQASDVGPAPAGTGAGRVGGMQFVQHGGTPFANAQVDVGTNVAPSAANSTRVIVLLLALLFTAGMAGAAASMLLVAGYLSLGDTVSAGDVTRNGGAKEHHRDSGVIENPDLQAVVVRQAAYRAQRAVESTDPMSEMFGGIGAGPVHVTASGPGTDRYSGIEVICEQVGFRKRAPLVGGRAHIPVVPAARCHLVFKGNVPVRTWVTGGDTITCTFDPIYCK